MFAIGKKPQFGGHAKKVGMWGHSRSATYHQTDGMYTGPKCGTGTGSVCFTRNCADREYAFDPVCNGTCPPSTYEAKVHPIMGTMPGAKLAACQRCCSHPTYVQWPYYYQQHTTGPTPKDLNAVRHVHGPTGGLLVPGDATPRSRNCFLNSAPCSGMVQYASDPAW